MKTSRDGKRVRGGSFRVKVTKREAFYSDESKQTPKSSFRVIPTPPLFFPSWQVRFCGSKSIYVVVFAMAVKYTLGNEVNETYKMKFASS